MARQAVLTRDRVVAHFLKRNLPRILRRYAPAEVWLFGSRVRGDALEESDLDVIIVSNRFADVPWPHRAGPVHVRCGVRGADVLCYTPEEFAHKRRQIGIVQAAVEEGIRVHPARRLRAPPPAVQRTRRGRATPAARRRSAGASA